MDNDEIFSYSSDKEPEPKGNSFDLNSFSSDVVESDHNKRRKKKTSKQRAVKTLLSVFLIGIITVSIIVCSFFIYVFTSVDGTMDEDLNDLKLNFTTTVYVKDSSDNWNEYQRLHGEYNRIWVAYDEKSAKDNVENYTGIPKNLVDAFVAIEDKRFFSHPGVDWKRTAKAFTNMFFHSSTSYGGSTITQQLVKNLTNDTDKKASRKIREIMRARYLESHYSKATIMECYLNTIALGHGMYGVEVASNYYFGKSVNELSLLECATLASITKSPSAYAPDVNPDENKRRRETVLSEMKSQGYITDEEYEKAMAEELKLVASKDSLNETEVNSYFIDALIKQVTKDIAKKYGYDEKHAATNFYSGGYKIYTTLNPDIQQKIESVFNDSKTYALTAKDGSKLQGAFTIMDYKGNVLGLAGGIGEKTVNLGISGFNRATDAIRQPGSTMKPLSAYAPSIESNLVNYSTIVKDTSTNYSGWTPKNWYGSYSGSITVKYALEHSVNTIPVYLVNKLTPQTSYDFLTQKLGITTLNSPEDVNLAPLGMGGTNGGITTMESAAAFSVFGNGGLYYKPTLYTKVCDQRNQVILEYESEPQVAISEDTATVMNHLLQNVVYGSRGTGTAAKSFINNMKIYAKTGTTNDQNDLWFVGGSPYYVASCWCGYDKQQGVSSSSIALRMWGAAMSKIHSGLQSKEFKDSDYAQQRYYCTQTGLLATSGCPSKEIGWYKSDGLPDKCTTHGGTIVDAPKKVTEKSDENSSKTSSSSLSTTSSANQ